MKTLLKVLFTLTLIFASTFILIRISGVLTIDEIRFWLVEAKNISPIYVGTTVFILLLIDLFIAVPTLTISVLAGYFLDWKLGFIAVSSGLTAAGISGYVLSRLLGRKIVNIVIKDPNKLNEMEREFNLYGIWMILLSRALPILPEVSACLAGITKMNFWKFISAWLVSTIPYAFIAAYSGSISTLENPKPAIFTIVGLSVVLWTTWYFFYKNRKRKMT